MNNTQICARVQYVRQRVWSPILDLDLGEVWVQLRKPTRALVKAQALLRTWDRLWEEIN